MEAIWIVALVFVALVVGVLLGMYLSDRKVGVRQRELDECRERLMRSGLSAPEDAARNSGCL